MFNSEVHISTSTYSHTQTLTGVRKTLRLNYALFAIVPSPLGLVKLLIDRNTPYLRQRYNITGAIKHENQLHLRLPRRFLTDYAIYVLTEAFRPPGD